VWIAHSNMTRFLKAADPELMRLNLVLLLFVSFLPFTTAVAATHLFASNLSLHEVTMSSPTERIAAVLFGLNLTLAALMLYLMLRHAGRAADVAADDLAEEELQAFATQRRSAVLLQASATVIGGFLPLLAVIFYLVLAVFYVIDPVRLMRIRSLRRASPEGNSAEDLRVSVPRYVPTSPAGRDQCDFGDGLGGPGVPPLDPGGAGGSRACVPPAPEHSRPPFGIRVCPGPVYRQRWNLLSAGRPFCPLCRILTLRHSGRRS
jgi:uncharacterized membrane protein